MRYPVYRFNGPAINKVPYNKFTFDLSANGITKGVPIYDNESSGLNVFNKDPVLPPNGYSGRSWNFYPKVHIQDNIGSLSKSGNIFLTNIQRFVTRNDEENKNSSIDYFLGEKPVSKTTDNKILVREIVNNISMNVN